MRAACAVGGATADPHASIIVSCVWIVFILLRDLAKNERNYKRKEGLQQY
jgi:hypothetical protein